MSEVLKRVNEIKVKKSLGMDVAYDFDFPWMGPIDRSEQNVLNALQRLENPLTRIKEELFWFWLDTETDKKAIDYLISGERQGAHNIWKEVIASNSEFNIRSISAFVNQTILAHSSVIGKEFILKYGDDLTQQSESLDCPKCKKTFSEDFKFCIYCGERLVIEKKTVELKQRSTNLNDIHWKNWRFVISKLFLVYSSDGFWNLIDERIKKIDDPRTAKLEIRQLRDDFLKEVSNVNFTFISSALFAKDAERLKQHSNLINGTSMPYEILRDGFNKALSSRIELLNKLSKSASEKTVKTKDLNELLNICREFKNDISLLFNECNIVDINCVSDFAIARDNISEVLRNIAIKINNKFNDYAKACPILNDAIQYASSTYLKQSLKKDEETLRSNLEGEKFLQYEEKIGGLFLKINKESISYGRQILKISEITALRYGSLIESTNGVETNRSFKVCLTDEKKNIEIEGRSGFLVNKNKVEENFGNITQRIYMLVQAPMITKMLSDFRSGRSFKIGGVTIDAQGWHKDFSYDPISKGFVSLSAKFFGGEDVKTREAKKRFMSWEDYWNHSLLQGQITIFRRNAKNNGPEEWISFSLRDTWNAVNLGFFLKTLYNEGDSSE
ncbi:hypothetical protein ACFL2J_00070 [Candidatus Omnitrophota bacterium]